MPNMAAKHPVVARALGTVGDKIEPALARGSPGRAPAEGLEFPGLRAPLNPGDVPRGSPLVAAEAAFPRSPGSPTPPHADSGSRQRPDGALARCTTSFRVIASNA